MITSEQIKANLEARLCAEELINLGESECIAGKLNRIRFWQIIADCAAEAINKHVVDNVTEMNEVQALAFEKTEMPYGKYQGQSIKQIVHLDKEYLPWIAENEFASNLKRYLRSKQYKQRLG